jgi:hypothetical protein
VREVARRRHPPVCDSALKYGKSNVCLNVETALARDIELALIRAGEKLHLVLAIRGGASSAKNLLIVRVRKKNRLRPVVNKEGDVRVSTFELTQINVAQTEKCTPPVVHSRVADVNSCGVIANYEKRPAGT